MYPLTHVIRPGFSLSWHEAVALVHEVAVAIGDLTTLPDPDDLFLEDNGTVVIGFASELAGNPVTSLAALLLELLQGVDAPAELRRLAADNAKTPPAHATVAGFTGALAFFERPERRSDVRAIASRLSARGAALRAEQELERLRERIVSSDEEGSPEKEPAVQQVRRPAFKLPRMLNRQFALRAGVAVTLLGSLAVAGLARARSVRTAAAAAAVLNSDGSVLPPATAGEDAKPANPAGEKKPSPNHVASAQTPAASPAKQAPVQRQMIPRATDPVSRGGERAGAQVTTEGRSAPRMFPLPPLTTVPSLPSVRSALPAAASGVKPGPSSTDARAVSTAPPAVELVHGHVYSAAEPNVTPARLTRSQLPREPAATADTGYFDLIVDERGDVEFVKLLSPTHRYQDRILVAAAKAWKFQPALLNGIPVKYRLRIPIILPDIAR